MAESSLKKTLLDNIEIQEDVHVKFHEILRRQTMVFVSAIFMMIIGLGAFIAIMTSPTTIDRSLVKYIESERTHIVQERVRLQNEQKSINKERELLNQERTLFIRTREYIDRSQGTIFPYNIKK